jgi:hypothetical protein
MQNKIEHTSVNGINLEPNKKLGYYLVDNEIYYSKYQTLLTASKHNKQVKWFFNEDVFIKFPWNVEPEESLDDLYRQRAQDLRDQYDYIRIEASGGSDSTNVIFSFLLNNIHLDEIWATSIPADASSLAGVVLWYNNHTMKQPVNFSLKTNQIIEGTFSRGQGGLGEIIQKLGRRCVAMNIARRSSSATGPLTA